MLCRAGIDDAGGRALPDWSPEGSLQAMDELGVATAILSVSTPGTTFLSNAADAVALARDLNDYGAISSHLNRSGSGSSRPSPCHTSTNPWPRPSAPSATLMTTADQPRFSELD
jgi:hypothetical protein